MARLDVMPATIAKFRTNGDSETADLLEHIIYRVGACSRLLHLGSDGQCEQGKGGPQWQGLRAGLLPQKLCIKCLGCLFRFVLDGNEYLRTGLGASASQPARGWQQNKAGFGVLLSWHTSRRPCVRRRRSRTVGQVCAGCRTCTAQRAAPATARPRPPGRLRRGVTRGLKPGSTRWSASTSGARSRCDR